MGVNWGLGGGQIPLQYPPPPYFLSYANGDEKITCIATHLTPQIHFVS